MSLSQAGQNELPWPTSTGELEPAEQFIVWSFRRWILGLKQNTGDHWNLVWDEFARQLGPMDARNALSGFAGLVKAMQCNARRRICYHQPCCPYLGADEVSVVCFVSACQNRQHRLAQSLAEWLVKADGTGDMLESGCRLAEGMRRHGLLLPERCGGTTPPLQEMDRPQAAARLH